MKKHFLTLVLLAFLLIQRPLFAGQQSVSVAQLTANETQSTVLVDLLRHFDPDTTSDVSQDSLLDISTTILTDDIVSLGTSALDSHHNNDLLEPLNFSSIKGLRGTAFASHLMGKVYNALGYHLSVTPYRTLEESINSYLLGADGELARAEVFANVTPLLVRVPEPLIRFSFYLVCRSQATCSKILPEGTQVAVSSEIVVVESWAKTNQLLTKRYQSIDDLFEAFNRTEIDFLILGSSDIFSHQTELETSTYRTIVTTPVYHYVHNKHNNLVPLIDRALKTFKMTEQYKQLLMKYWLHGNR
ncbi:MAG: hypothetical protein ACI88A_005271 [Paraglaciecola sp.]|jgi:hypothetical protein